jgi:hypothetical protein
MKPQNPVKQAGLRATRFTTDSHRNGARILDRAEGVLVALRRCTIDDAFFDIVRTAERHQVAPLTLAGALLAIAQNGPTHGIDATELAAARLAWDRLSDQPAESFDVRLSRES